LSLAGNVYSPEDPNIKYLH